MKKIVALFLLLVLCVTETVLVLAEPTTEEAATENVIEISTAEELIALAEACRLDVYSLGKIVELKANVDLSGYDFSGIPYFNGVFNGNGYTISGLSITEKGSQVGLFRYIGELGIVSNLKVMGIVMPEGSQEEVGGIAGVNYGTIQKSSFVGTVYGVKNVGAIVGRNTSYGQILGCNSNAIVMATDQTGGIAGRNEGIIDDCINKSQINTEELEPAYDIEGIDLGDLNVTQNVVTRNNMGGIAGYSMGIIKNCHNYGTVGYAHTGYNVGGIAGCQNGIVYDCVNDGDIFGRKDVGGIVGQAAPYIESEYLAQQIEQTKSDLDRMNRTLENLSNSLEKTSEEAGEYAEALTAQYEASNGSLSDRLDQMEDTIPEDNKEAQECMDNISNAQKKIDDILNKEGTLTQDDLKEIQKQQEIIEENTKRLEEIYEEENAGSDNNVSEDISNTDTSNLEGLADSLQAGMDSITNSIDSLTKQTEAMTDHIYNNTAVIRGEKNYIVDISSLKTASELDGVISGCQNRGTIEGDLNVGGIAGTMNIEYEEEPEEDFDASEDLDIATSSEVNDVIISSVNYGEINSKKNCAGSIVGLQEFGYLYDCEGYGHVNASAGDYVGGIAGKSGGTIEKSYSMVDLEGSDYVGGIAGEGASILNCLSITKIDSEGECLGGIAGNLEKGGSAKGNFFVKDNYDGIDDISYYGIAEPTTYEALMLLEDVPTGFQRVSVAFVLEEDTISEIKVPYGSNLTLEDFPSLPNTEDSYVKWPEESEYTNITNSITLEAEYVPWTQSVAAEADGYEKPLFIAVADFYEGAEIALVNQGSEGVPVTLTENQELLYSYDWKFSCDREKEFTSVEGHFYIPEQYRESEILVLTLIEDTWTTVATEWDGSYVVAKIPFEGAFAVVEVQADDTSFYLTIGAGILVLILVISMVIIHNKRKKKANKDDK